MSFAAMYVQNFESNIDKCYSYYETIEGYYTWNWSDADYTVGFDTSLSSRLYLSLLSELGVNRNILQISLLFSLLLCTVLALVAQLFSRDMVQETEKKSSYECGFFPFDSATRLPFDVHFYVVGIMFLVFDVELIILTTIIILAATMPWTALASVAGFVIVLTVGFVYEWNCGALRWESKIPEPVQRSSSVSAALSFILPLLCLIDLSAHDSLYVFVVFSTLNFFVPGFIARRIPSWRKKFKKIVRRKKPPQRKKLEKVSVLPTQKLPWYIKPKKLVVISPRTERDRFEPTVLRRRPDGAVRKNAVYTWRRRQTVPSPIALSWRPRFWYQRTRRVQEIFIKRKRRFSWSKRYFRVWHDDILFVTKRWRGYHARYSYIKRLRFHFRTRIIPPLHYHMARIHRWPLFIAFSFFIVPAVCVPVPWFLDDKEDAWRDLVHLYEYVHRHLLEDSVFLKYYAHPWLVNVVAVLFLYPVAVLNLICAEHWPLMFFVGLGVARCCYLFGASPWVMYRRLHFARRFRRWGRIVYRRKLMDAYDIFLDQKSTICPHPDLGQEDAFSRPRPGRRRPQRKLSLLLLALIVPVAVSAFGVPFELFRSRGDIAFDLRLGRRPWWRCITDELDALCWAFNHRARAITLVILLCGIVHGFTGLFISILRRLMHPRCGRWVLPPLFSALVLYLSFRGLTLWWELNTFPMGKRFAEGWMHAAARRGWWGPVARAVGYLSVFVGLYFAFMARRKTVRYWVGHQSTHLLRRRYRRNLRNRKFMRCVLIDAFDPFVLHPKQLAAKRAARKTKKSKKTK